MDQEIEEKIRENNEKIERLYSENSNKKLVWGIILISLSALLLSLAFLNFYNGVINNNTNDAVGKLVLAYFLFILSALPLPPGVLLLVFGKRTIRRRDAAIAKLKEENKELRNQK